MVGRGDPLDETPVLLRTSRECINDAKALIQMMQDRVQTTGALVMETDDLIRRSDLTIRTMETLGATEDTEPGGPRMCASASNVPVE